MIYQVTVQTIILRAYEAMPADKTAAAIKLISDDYDETELEIYRACIQLRNGYNKDYEQYGLEVLAEFKKIK